MGSPGGSFFTSDNSQMASDIILTKEAIIPNTKHITQLLQFLSEYNDISHFQTTASTQQRYEQNDRFSTHNIAIRASERTLKSREDRIKQKESELNDHKQSLNDLENELFEKQRTLTEREKKCNHKMAMMETDEELFERKRVHQQQQMELLTKQSHMNTRRDYELKQRELQILM